jgi:hypothetical protein
MGFQDLRRLLVRPALPALALLGLLVAACSSVGGPTYTFWDVVWSMVIFFFWFMLIWIFISIFADIFRRNDMSGGWKAIWIIAIFIVPFFGALVYIIMRPKVTAQDVQMMTRADAARRPPPASARPTRSEAQPAQGLGCDHRPRVRSAQEEGDRGLIPRRNP